MALSNTALQTLYTALKGMGPTSRRTPPTPAPPGPAR